MRETYGATTSRPSSPRQANSNPIGHPVGAFMDAQLRGPVGPDENRRGPVALGRVGCRVAIKPGPPMRTRSLEWHPLPGPVGPDENRRGPVAPVLRVPIIPRVPAGTHEGPRAHDWVGYRVAIIPSVTVASHASLPGRAAGPRLLPWGSPGPETTSCQNNRSLAHSSR